MTLDDASARIELCLSDVLKTLSDLDVQIRALKTVGLFGRQHVDDMSQQLEGVARRALSHAERIIVGVGAAWEDDGDAASGMLWWRADSGEVSRKIHISNPSSESYYDYERTPWHDHALRALGKVIVVGPYVDAWGTDDHALTPARAVTFGDITLGVAAVDLDVYRATEALAAALAPDGDALVLINDDQQVVAANQPLLTPGDRLAPYLQSHGYEVREKVAMRAISGWYVARLAKA